MLRHRRRPSLEDSGLETKTCLSNKGACCLHNKLAKMKACGNRKQAEMPQRAAQRSAHKFMLGQQSMGYDQSTRWRPAQGTSADTADSICLWKGHMRRVTL